MQVVRNAMAFGRSRTGATTLLLALLGALAGCATLSDQDSKAAAARYQTAIASPLRTEADRRLDSARHPSEFLPFTGVKPGMQVLDIAAGAGYTSQLLALAVGPTGMVWAQAQQPGATLTKRLADNPQSNLTIVARSFEDPVPDQAPKLDLITIVLNYHDISYLPVDRAKMNQRLYAALKPGGHLVIIDHAARDGTGVADGKTLHRIDKAVVLAEVARAGFVLEEENDFLRNRADPRDQTSTDSKIPTDKFALRFVKPL